MCQTDCLGAAPTMSRSPAGFWWNLLSSFCIILPTKLQTNRHDHKHSLLGGGADVSAYIYKGGTYLMYREINNSVMGTWWWGVCSYLIASVGLLLVCSTNLQSLATAVTSKSQMSLNHLLASDTGRNKFKWCKSPGIGYFNQTCSVDILSVAAALSSQVLTLTSKHKKHEYGSSLLLGWSLSMGQHVLWGDSATLRRADQHNFK